MIFYKLSDLSYNYYSFCFILIGVLRFYFSFNIEITFSDFCVNLQCFWVFLTNCILLNEFLLVELRLISAK